MLGEVFLLPLSELPRGFDPWCERLPEHTTRFVQHGQTGRIFLDSTFLSFYLEAYSSWEDTSRPAFGKALGKAEQTRLRRALVAYPIIQSGHTASLPSGPEVSDDRAAPKVPRRLLRYALRESFREALLNVIDALLQQHKRTGIRPTRGLVTDFDHRKLWPEEIQPSRRQLYDLLIIHTLDFDALVEERQTALSSPL